MKFAPTHFHSFHSQGVDYYAFSPKAWASMACPTLNWEARQINGRGEEQEAIALTLSAHIGGVKVGYRSLSVGERPLKGVDARLSRIEIRINALILATGEWKRLWDGEAIVPHSSEAGATLINQLRAYAQNEMSASMARALDHTLTMYGAVGV